MGRSSAVLYQHLLADLAKEIDVQLPSWAPDSSSKEASCYILRDSLLKKFNETDEPSHDACKAAIEKFVAVNARCRRWSIPYEFSQDEMLVGGLKQVLHKFWFDDDGSSLVEDYRDIFHRGRTGPGASIKAQGNDLYTKMFDSPLSCTARAREIWERVSPLNGLWAEAEAERSKIHGIHGTEVSNLSCVIKTTTIARTICTEPSLNMWLQLGMGGLIEERLYKRFGIRLDQQPDINRVMARRGSMDGSLATIDLSSASDSMAYNVLKEILPRQFFAVLDALRTPSTRLPPEHSVSRKGDVLPLHMISTMGNGYTFPLQTMLFAAVVQSVYRYIGLPFVGFGPGERRTFSVFGDDIIVDRRAFYLVNRLLYLLGFQINTDKTFVEGRFRESCGADYIDGDNVRGVYIKSLNTIQDLFVAINTLVRWSAKSAVALPRTIGYLLKGIRDRHRYLVPPDEDDAAGIHCPAEYVSDVREKPYIKGRNGQWWYQARVPQKWEFIVIGGHCWTYKGQNDRNHNPAGLEVAAIYGTIRGYRVSLRQRVTKYRTHRKWTPRWGYIPPRPHELPIGGSWDRLFVEACDRNLVDCGFWGHA